MTKTTNKERQKAFHDRKRKQGLYRPYLWLPDTPEVREDLEQAHKWIMDRYNGRQKCTK